MTKNRTTFGRCDNCGIMRKVTLKDDNKWYCKQCKGEDMKLRPVADTFSTIINEAKYRLQHKSKLVHTEKWQGVSIVHKPEMATFEVRHLFLQCPMQGEDLQMYRDQIKPSQPWADDHFAERVCGQPINPGMTWENWPWGHSAKNFLDAHGKFNHNYMERYWPKHAGLFDATLSSEGYGSHLKHLQEMNAPNARTHRGIYHEYGDLRDVIDQLAREPQTRQAILPVFFPEDTGAVHGGRVPCSLAYQFMMRDNQLDVSYWLRSCDYLRHFRDDIYLTARLCLWVLQELRKIDSRWDNVWPGQYTMLITSLHLFRNDWYSIFGEHR